MQSAGMQNPYPARVIIAHTSTVQTWTECLQ
jgi:hypothetical protein